MRHRQHQHDVAIGTALPPEAAFEALWRHGADRLHINIPDTLTFVEQPESDVRHVRWLLTAKNGRVLAKRSAIATGRKVTKDEHQSSAKRKKQIQSDDEPQLSEREMVMIEEQMVRKAFGQFARDALCSKESNPQEIAARM
jgi:hypothetical protein